MDRIATSLRALRRLVRLQNAMMVLCAVVVCAYGASMFASLHRAYRQTLDDASATLESIARSSEVGTNRSIFAIDAALLGVQRTLETLLPDTPLDDALVKTLLNQLDDQTLVVRDILILDNAGRLLNKSGWRGEREPDYADEPFFTAHQKGGLPSLFIGRPKRSRATGGWSVMMSRPLMRHDTVIGVVAAEVPINVFSDFYSAVVANSGVSVKLFLDDGTLVATEPHKEELIGRPLPNAAAVIAGATGRRIGLLGQEQDAAKAHLVAFARIPARPMMLIASRSRSDILAQWNKECAGSLAAFVVFALTAVSLTWMIVRALGRQQKAATELRVSEERLQRQSDLLQSTLENMGEGLSVFDRYGRLIASNARFTELLDLPPELIARGSLREIHAFQTARGDFGPPAMAVSLEDRMARFYEDVPSVQERVAGSGRTLQIRRRAMPGGAVVSLYSDITERKAAEVKMAQAWAQA
ncbi:MAG TPA: PAS-domain containing protein, partial [Stellaceae bacterium]|nr:PAS-domain containing protein [Stellaceae bacterium]